MLLFVIFVTKKYLKDNIHQKSTVHIQKENIQIKKKDLIPKILGLLFN